METFKNLREEIDYTEAAWRADQIEEHREAAKKSLLEYLEWHFSEIEDKDLDHLLIETFDEGETAYTGTVDWTDEAYYEDGKVQLSEGEAYLNNIVDKLYDSKIAHFSVSRGHTVYYYEDSEDWEDTPREDSDNEVNAEWDNYDYYESQLMIDEDGPHIRYRFIHVIAAFTTERGRWQYFN